MEGSLCDLRRVTCSGVVVASRVIRGGGGGGLPRVSRDIHLLIPLTVHSDTVLYIYHLWHYRLTLSSTMVKAIISPSVLAVYLYLSITSRPQR